MLDKTPRKSWRLVLLLVALPAVVLGATFASSQGDRLTDVRVCGQAAIDRREGECKRDQSRSAIASPTFFCSAQVRGESGERFSGRFFYEGIAFPRFGTKTTDDPRGLFVYVTVGPTSMPGGRWGCELRVGAERVRKSFRSAGPTGPILYVAVCSTARTAEAGPARVCRRDASPAAFSAAESVTCSAVFVGNKGKIAGFEFLHEGKDVGLGQDFQLPLPVTAAGPRLDPEPQLVSGRWTCRWTLAGRVVASKDFRIS